MSKRGGLGRGLSALIPGAPESGEASGLLEVPVNAVSPNPKQPRTHFDDEAIAALAVSIREVGILQPIVVRKAGAGYELIAGERRLRAAKLAGCERQARRCGLQQGVRAGELDLIGARVDDEQQIALFDNLPVLKMDLGQRAANLRAQFDPVDRGKLAE